MLNVERFCFPTGPSHGNYAKVPNFNFAKSQETLPLSFPFTSISTPTCLVSNNNEISTRLQAPSNDALLDMVRGFRGCSSQWRSSKGWHETYHGFLWRIRTNSYPLPLPPNFNYHIQLSSQLTISNSCNEVLTDCVSTLLRFLVANRSTRLLRSLNPVLTARFAVSLKRSADPDGGQECGLGHFTSVSFNSGSLSGVQVQANPENIEMGLVPTNTIMFVIGVG